MLRFLLICLGGAAGTGTRYLVAVGAARLLGTLFPLGTLAVNVVGSFLLCILMELSISTDLVSGEARLILGTGFLGGFTTYSTFNYETLMLLRQGSIGVAAANMAATIFGCLAAGALGFAVARALAQ